MQKDPLFLLQTSAMSVGQQFIPTIAQRFKAYKKLGDDTFKQLQEQDFFFSPSAESNNIAIIIQHFYGNAMSRFTDFLTTDGEKSWRNRDAEFEPMDCSKQDLISFWNTGWHQVLTTIEALTEDDLTKTVLIRSEPLVVFDAVLRQLAHYAYHVGQVVYIGKQIRNSSWKSLSIPRGKSTEYNQA